MEEKCKNIIKDNNELINQKTIDEFLDTQGKNWEKFYKLNKTNFFKDRHYILKELAELRDDNRVLIIII